MFYFYPFLGRWSKLTNLFFKWADLSKFVVIAHESRLQCPTGPSPPSVRHVQRSSLATWWNLQQCDRRWIFTLLGVLEHWKNSCNRCHEISRSFCHSSFVVFSLVVLWMIWHKGAPFLGPWKIWRKHLRIHRNVNQVLSIRVMQWTVLRIQILFVERDYINYTL